MNAIAALLSRLFSPKEPTDILDIENLTFDVPQAHIVALPSDMTKLDLTADIDKLATKLQPWRRTGTARMADLPSLIAWANRNKGETSALFATTGEKPQLTCIADYLGAGAPVINPTSRDPAASHMSHRATYAFPLSREWQAWTSISGTGLSGPDLGEFVEANAKDLLEPTPALISGRPAEAKEDWEREMLDIAQQLQGRFGQYINLVQLARNFQINEVSNIAASMNWDTGESSIQFLNEHREADGAAVRIPNLFMIAIPVFENGAAYRLPVRFRYRKSGSAVKFIFTLHNADLALKNAINEALRLAEAETGMPLFRGAPETLS